MKIPENIKYIIGIDEAGRGPLAGPVAVGVCVVSADLTRKILLKKFSPPGLKILNDSKKLTERQREAWFSQMLKMKKQTEYLLDFSVTLVSNKIIDEKRITFAIKKAMQTSLSKLQKKHNLAPAECLVLLDGGLRAPKEFSNQITIIKGDEKEFVISLASIGAKVLRDAHMRMLAKQHPLYCFENNKGYGTEEHIAAIKKEGISSIHRATFLRNIL